MRPLFLFVTLCFSVATLAQTRTAADAGFTHLTLTYKGDPVEVLIKSKKGEEQQQKPLFFFCQGSLPVPLIMYSGNDMYGTFPFNRNSTAFAADYYAAHLRGCLEGWIFWLDDVNPAYGPGDLWGCVGTWFSGDWHSGAADQYASEVRAHLDNRVWLQPGFENDKPGCNRTYGCPGPDPM